jgi:hypothetical protein
MAKLESQAPAAPDAAAATAAAALPYFSAGTAPLEAEENFAPAATPAIGGEVTIDPNATGALDDDAMSGAAAQAAAAGRARDPKTGKFQPDKPADAAARTQSEAASAQDAPAPAAATAPRAGAATPAQRESAADAAAEAMLDDWADAVEIPFEHDDGSRYTVRAKRAEAKQIERFNRRQAMVDKAANYLGSARPALEPLVADGRLAQFVPVIQRVVADPELARFIGEAYQRRLNGLPLTPQQAAPAQAPAAVLAATSSGVAASNFTAEALGITDPYVAEQVAPLIAALAATDSRARAAEQQAQTWTQQQRQAAEQQQRAAAESNWRGQRVREAHMDLVRMYPGEFSGDFARDEHLLRPIFDYARNGGYNQMYPDPRAAVVTAAGAYRASLIDTGSPAAAVLARSDQTMRAAANAQAAGARSVAGGTGAAQPAAKRPPPPKPTNRRPDGKLKSPAEFMAEQQAWIGATRASA